MGIFPVLLLCFPAVSFLVWVEKTLASDLGLGTTNFFPEAVDVTKISVDKTSGLAFLQNTIRETEGTLSLRMLSIRLYIFLSLFPVS